MPSAPPGMVLPDDLLAFYRLAGGAILFETSDYRMDIVSPSDFRPANAALFGIAESGDISDGWFVVATCGSPVDVVTVDLHPARLGRCYFSFPDVHAVAGSSDILATSFSALVTAVLNNEGRYWFWLMPTSSHLATPTTEFVDAWLPPGRAVRRQVGRMTLVDVLTGLGVAMAIGCGVRTVIAVVTRRERERTGLDDPQQAHRATWIYGSGTLAGLILIALSRAG